MSNEKIYPFFDGIYYRPWIRVGSLGIRRRPQRLCRLSSKRTGGDK